MHVPDSTQEVHLDNEQFVKYLLQYLSTLQEGRVKPNSNSDSPQPVIRDSIDNLPDIKAVKHKLNYIFNIVVKENDIIKK
jgi:hypothetical protein